VVVVDMADHHHLQRQRRVIAEPLFDLGQAGTDDVAISPLGGAAVDENEPRISGLAIVQDERIAVTGIQRLEREDHDPFASMSLVPVGATAAGYTACSARRISTIPCP